MSGVNGKWQIIKWGNSFVGIKLAPFPLFPPEIRLVLGKLLRWLPLIEVTPDEKLVPPMELDIILAEESRCLDLVNPLVADFNDAKLDDDITEVGREDFKSYDELLPDIWDIIDGLLLVPPEKWYVDDIEDRSFVIDCELDVTDVAAPPCEKLSSSSAPIEAKLDELPFELLYNEDTCFERDLNSRRPTWATPEDMILGFEWASGGAVRCLYSFKRSKNAFKYSVRFRDLDSIRFGMDPPKMK